jgi:hypothetical protein
MVSFLHLKDQVLLLIYPFIGLANSVKLKEKF